MAVTTDDRLSVREWPESERPREKLAQYGASALSTAALLAIILRTGTAREDVVAMAQRLLVQKGGLLGLAHASMTELAAEPGLDWPKAPGSRPRSSWASAFCRTHAPHARRCDRRRMSPIWCCVQQDLRSPDGAGLLVVLDVG
jgi:DNA repair protein RadC